MWGFVCEWDSLSLSLFLFPLYSAGVYLSAVLVPVSVCLSMCVGLPILLTLSLSLSLSFSLSLFLSVNAVWAVFLSFSICLGPSASLLCREAGHPCSSNVQPPDLTTEFRFVNFLADRIKHSLWQVRCLALWLWGRSWLLLLLLLLLLIYLNSPYHKKRTTLCMGDTGVPLHGQTSVPRNPPGLELSIMYRW